MVMFRNGDKYIGDVQGGKKHGEGMYVYANCTAFKGTWVEDELLPADGGDGRVMHPVQGDALTEDVKRLQDANEWNATGVATLKQKIDSERGKPFIPSATLLQG